MNRIAVFCGSSSHVDVVFARVARELGRLIATHQLELVYGGASIGLMGEVADGCLEAGGRVIGVMPDFMSNLEITHQKVQDMKIVSSMHERKKVMSDLADAFITLPGGFGTMDEFFEIITWRQIHLHQKPIAILNTNGYYNSLIEFANTAVSAGFVRQEHRDLWIIEEDPKQLLIRLTAH